MIINRVKFRDFGRWIDQEIHFRSGINLITAPNESGKSTLLKGIVALLYGSRKEGTSKQVKADWYKRYFPWQTNSYGGEVDFTISKSAYRLIRVLTLPGAREQLISLHKGEELTHNFPLDSRKDRLFLDKLTGLSCTGFTQMCFMTGQERKREYKDEREKQMKLVREVRGALSGQHVDVHPVLAKLEKRLGQIGKLDRSTKELGHIVGICTTLEKEIQTLKEESASYVQLLKEREDLKREIARLHEERKKARENYIGVRLREHREKRDTCAKRYSYLEHMREEEAYHQISRLHKFTELEKNNCSIDCTDDEVSELTQIEMDIEMYQRLEEEERRIRVAHDARVSVASVNFRWWIVTGIGYACTLFSMIFSDILFLLSLIASCYLTYQLFHRYKKWKSDTAANEENTKNLLSSLHAALNQKEDILKKHVVLSLGGLYDRREKMKERMNSKGTPLSQLQDNEREMEKIHQEVKVWLSQHVNVLPPFDPVQWINEIRAYVCKAQQYKKDLALIERDIMRMEREQEKCKDHSSEFDQYGYSDPEIMDKEEELSQCKEELARIDGVKEAMQKQLASLSQKEEEWQVYKEKQEELKKEREICLLLKEVLLEASLELKKNISPLLIPKASSYLYQLSNARYDELLINIEEGIELHVYAPETGEVKPIMYLSNGTVDQIVMALRLSLLELYKEHTSISLPLILDDCFAHFDDIRLKNALIVLKELSERHQVILCTSQVREREMLEALNIPTHTVSIVH